MIQLLPYTIPGIVTDVSAIFVATTIFRRPRGVERNTFNCSVFGREPYIGRTKGFTGT
jgi:hypothetical protein